MAFNLSNNKQMQQNRESNKIDIIEKTTVIVGNITSQADFRIDGRVEGTISTSGKVVIGEEGIVSGKIVCENSEANWMDFKPLVDIQGQKHKTKEVIFYRKS